MGKKRKEEVSGQQGELFVRKQRDFRACAE